MTFSIVARDAATGDLGVAVQSKFLAVGAVVPWARAGVGAVATQAFANVGYGPDGLAALAAGATAAQAIERLVGADDLRAERQVGIVDAAGRAANHTGHGCFRWAGGRIGDNYAAQGNILAGPEVVDALAERFVAGGLPFAELLAACLADADAAGGDRRGRQSAALLVVRDGGGYGGGNDRWIDLRVDDHADPIGELGRVLALQRLYFDRPAADTLVPLDAALAAELRSRLETLGASPGGPTGATYQPMAGAAPASEPRPAIGVAREIPVGWDAAWQRALVDWMAVENLEERTAAPGWIDPRVIEFIRGRSPAS
ncbi:MAG TPA: DUF1028 domain-containing protein [Candidatus Limnocylindrales bacterium]|nr:DUF1028 domain-containing protein [Candidatus Limnocylindrales bacterium]